ncbi:hypothetical protein CONLIGDRAFT_678571 [Coniochaeta ligniaria NRRL 30616]|uniref:DNA polymerase delta subunit 3 n=1 Tax=Coniochaeta ligniaria NRRL 30616 TaxID=1408157 RepID=A0A1J7JS10_9PEZI|nr:hypothetical protein CONLIGDRAFT_678571 [Coniochaeta ligniaria NRRL 30616]
MDDYKTYLAENVLSEDKVITYRFLSRALKVHVNTAKQMLFDFHKGQNGKRPGSVHATYLVYGTKKDEHASSQPRPSQDDDVDMMSSMPEQEETDDVVPVQTLSLIPENELKDALQAYEEVKSIHVYSLGPHPVKDVALLSDAARQVLTLSTPEDVPSNLKIYGTITNANVRRRERKGLGSRLAAAAPAAPKAAAPKIEAKPAAKPAAAAAKVKEEPKETQKAPTPAPSAPVSSAASKRAKPALQRGGSGGLMAAFAKGAAAKAKKAESQPATPSGDDSSVHPLSDDEEDDSAVLPKPKAPETAAAKSRAQQRKEELQRMMEQDDDEEEVQEKEDTPMEEPEEPEEEKPAPESAKEEPVEVVSASGDGRRRGKRKVMKARRFLDEEGNMVTVREEAWESFSEDEAPPPPAPKPKSASSAPAAKGKKAAPKGQGSIMSFFNKKT